jgi:orotidine-5'-phosphate decarboxylase
VNFTQTLDTRILEKNTRLCLGLDPRLELHQNSLEKVEQHCMDVLENCADLVACVKPNLAYYEAMGIAGMQLLEKLCALARVMGIPIILDGKRGDFPSTAEAYAKAWLTGQHAGSALTMNPYLGFETIETFLGVARENDSAVFVLVKTSNAGSKDIQDLETKNGTVAQVIAKYLETQTQGGYGAVGAVVGATHATELEAWRKLMPNVLLLLPGLGAQGAKATDLAAAFDQNGLGALASASRAIQYASSGSDYAQAARASALSLRDELNLALKK